MSIRPRYTRRADKRSATAELPIEAFMERGKVAFARGDYTAAIQAWHQILSVSPLEDTLSSRLRTAVAEAFFRRALSTTESSVEDLIESVHLAPDEPRYQYHLALAYHRRNAWQSAILLYRELLERTPPYIRAAFPLSIALLETGGQPQADIVWQFLSSEEREHILRASALLKRQGKKDLRRVSSQGAYAFWIGLAALRLRSPEAETYLAAALKDPAVPRRAVGIGRYYLGVLAWERGCHAEALEHWQAAAEAGIQTPWLSGNLAWAYARSAIALLNAGELSSLHPPNKGGSVLSQALSLAEQGLRYAPDNLALRVVANHTRQHLGYRAAREGDWSTAWKHLWSAYQAGQRGRALMINLALTVEALGHYARAGSLWQQLMRSRPRKATSEGFMSNEQIARGWQRAAQYFTRAGSYEEAARAYRNALRYAPQDVALQLELITVLVQDERYGSAYSVVTNLLSRELEHKEALAWKAYLQEQLGNPYGAMDTWQRVLQLEPDHPAARQHIAHLSCRLGDVYLERGDLRRALVLYHEGLEIAPKDARLRASLIRLYGQLGDLAKAQEETERLLIERPDDLEVYYWLIITWLRLRKNDAVQEYLRRAEALQPAPPVGFYIALGIQSAENRFNQWANRFAGIAQQHPSIDAQGLLDLARIFFATGEPEQVIKCLEQAIALAPEMAEAHLLLGMYLLPRAQAKQKAKEHLLQAERLARQERNVAIIAQARRALSTLQMGEVP